MIIHQERNYYLVTLKQLGFHQSIADDQEFPKLVVLVVRFLIVVPQQ